MSETGGSVEESVALLREERSLLELRLEEAHIHLSDIKSSWSSKIASLETQVPKCLSHSYYYNVFFIFSAHVSKHEATLKISTGR